MRKKRLIVWLMVLVMVLTGCANKEANLNDKIDKLEAEISQLEAERDRLNNEILDIKLEKGLEKYIVTFNIKQTHLSLDIGKHLKDSMNDISIEIPVDKEFYDSVEIGDVIDDSFRMGSLLVDGSLGNWKISVEGKDIR